jgi:hypothetical protein
MSLDPPPKEGGGGTDKAGDEGRQPLLDDGPGQQEDAQGIEPDCQQDGGVMRTDQRQAQPAGRQGEHIRPELPIVLDQIGPVRMQNQEAAPEGIGPRESALEPPESPQCLKGIIPADDRRLQVED